MATFEETTWKAKEEALRSVSEARSQLKLWMKRQPVIPSIQNELWMMNARVLGGIWDCLSIENTMLQDAKLNPPAAASPEARKAVLEAHYLLFHLIDGAARVVKTTIATTHITPDLVTSSKVIKRNARRSLYLHYRVVNLARACPRLRSWYEDPIVDLAKTLEDIRGPDYDVFLAHASADKSLVERVVAEIKQRGVLARTQLIEAIEKFAGDTDDIERVYATEQEKLDLLTLPMWLDKNVLIPGDNLNSAIRTAIKSAKVFLVFVTPNYDLGKYMQDIELPQIGEEFKQLEREQDVRAIPIVLAPSVWKERKPEWLVPWTPVTCPPEPELFKYGPNPKPEDLVSAVVASLTDDDLLKSITGADLSDLIAAR